MEQLHAKALQGNPIRLATRSRQVIESHYGDTFVRFHQIACEVTAGETAHARNEVFHFSCGAARLMAAFPKIQIKLRAESACW